MIIKKNTHLEAKGDVEIRLGDRLVKADTLKFDRDANKLFLENIKEFKIKDNVFILSERGEIDANLQNGIISAAEILLDNKLKIEANKINIDDGKLKSFHGISKITSCDQCHEKEPLWQFSASSAKRDFGNSDITYRNVKFKVKGIPVAYIPIIRLPDPTVERAQGFLIPTVSITSNLGAGVKLPYFIPMGQSRDLLTPYLSNKTKTIEYRYRQALIDGNINIEGAVSQDDLRDSELRFFGQLEASVKLGYGINLKMSGGRSTDGSYLPDYGFHDASDFDTEVSVSTNYVKSSSAYSANLGWTRDIENGLVKDDFVVLSGNYSKRISRYQLPGNIFWNTRVESSLNLDSGDNLSRPPSLILTGLNYARQTHEGIFALEKSAFVTAKSFVNSYNNDSLDEETALEVGTWLGFKAPLQKKDLSKMSLITPRFGVALNWQNESIDGDYFIGSDEPNFMSVYSSNKIASTSEAELGLSSTLGFDYNISWYSGYNLKLAWL